MVTKAKKALLASLAAFLCVMLTVFGLSMSVSLSETAKAADETAVNAINLDAFVKNLENAGYNYDGNGVTVKWSPVSGCYDTREGHTCTVNNVKATANTPKRVNSGLTQFQLFEGKDVDVTVKNVKFVYEPAAFTVCENSNWKGSFTAEQAPAGQLYFMTTGSVAFEGCTFDKTVLTTFNTTSTSSVKKCTFTNVYNSYAVKDIRGKNVAVEGCTFEKCGAAIMVSSTGKVQNVSLTGNTFKDVDVAGTAPAAKVGTRGLIQIAANGDYSAATISASGNTATNCGPVVRQLNDTVKVDETLKSDLKKLSANGSSLYTSDSKKYVVKVGNTEYNTLDAAFAALSSENYTLTLLDESVWYTAKPVYWKAGRQSGYVAKLTDALTAAYKANAGDIVIVCRPGADVGTMTHGHVADNLTIYGNNAYISDGECDLEVDRYKFSRTTGTQANDGAYLEKNITINAYELDNLGVWGERHTAYTVNVNLTDCDGKEIAGNNNVQRVYISGTAGVNNFTITDCDFKTKATSIYSNADGKIVVSDCTFTGTQVPLNINHKADGALTLKVTSSTFTSCGDAGEWKKFAAPARFVNSGSGTMTVTANTLTFSGTVGSNGDILLGDGREGQKSNDVTLEVTSTAANIQAQKPGYYNDDGTTNETKGGTLVAVATESYTTTVEDLAPLTDYVVVGGIAGFEGKKFASFEEAYNAIKPIIGTLGLGQESASATAFDAIFTDRDENGNAKLTYTIKGNVVYDETGLSYLLTMGRKASHYGNDRHLIKFAFVGVTADKKDTLTVNSNITLPYEWWGEKVATSISFENLTITGSAPNGLYPSQAFFEGIDFTVNNCTLNGIKIYNCSNVGGSYTITNSVLDGTGAAANAYAIHLQGNKTAPLTINISGNTISGYDRGVNIDQATANATISDNTISVNDAKRSCIQLTGLAETTIADNNLNLTGGNAITLHEKLAEGSKITVQANTIAGNGYLIYDDTQKAIDLTYGANTVAATVDMTKGVYGDTTKDLSDDVYNEVHHVLAEVNGVKFATLQAAIDAAKDGETVKLLADIDLDEQIATGKAITIDGQGKYTIKATKKLVGTNNKAGMFYRTTSAQGTLTFLNVTLDGNGVSKIFLNEGGAGETVFDGVTSVNGGGIAYGSGIHISGGGSHATIKNSTLTGSTGTMELNKANYYAANDLWVGGNVYVTVENSTIGTVFVNSAPSATATNGVVHGQLTITGENTKITYLSGEEESVGKVDKFGNNGSLVKIDSGSVDTIFDMGSYAISGGTFKTEIKPEYCADGFVATKNADGTFGVKEGTYVAEVNGVKYETLAAAFEAARVGTSKVVTLLADYTATEKGGNNPGVVYDITGVTFDLGGHKFSASNFAVVFAGSNGVIQNGEMICLNGPYALFIGDEIETKGFTASNLTLTGGINVYNATMVVLDNLTVNGKNYYAVWADENASITIESGTYTAGDVALLSGAAVDLSTINVTGGTFITNDKPLMGNSKGTLQISGGTFSSEVEKDYLADRFVVNKNTDGTYGVTAGKGFAKANVVLNESLAMKVTIEKEIASEYVLVTYISPESHEKVTVKLEELIGTYYLFNKIMPQMIDVEFTFELYGAGDVMLDRKVNYSIVDYLANIIAGKYDSVAFRNVAASLIAYANNAKAVKGLAKIAPTFVKGDEIVDLDAIYTKFVGENQIPAKDSKVISTGDAQVVYMANVVFDSAYTLKFYVDEGNENKGKYTYKLTKGDETKDIEFDENGVYAIDILASDITTDYVLNVYGEDKTNAIQTVTYSVSTYCIRMQNEVSPYGGLYVATYYYGIAVQQYVR